MLGQKRKESACATLDILGRKDRSVYVSRQIHTSAAVDTTRRVSRLPLDGAQRKREEEGLTTGLQRSPSEQGQKL